MRRRVPTVLALWTAVFVVAYGTNVPTPLLLVYRDTLDLSPTQITGAFGVYAAGLVPALLLAGPASDRFGRRPVVIPFVLLSVVTSLLFLGAIPLGSPLMGWVCEVFGARAGLVVAGASTLLAAIALYPVARRQYVRARTSRPPPSTGMSTPVT